MFDLEQAVADWRKQMLSAGIKSPVPLEELELHCKCQETASRQVKLGLASQDAFNPADQKIGEALHLKVEFNKANTPPETRLVTLAGAACFVVALFFSLWTLPFLFHHETGVLAKISGLAAVAITILSWGFSHKFLPVIRNPSARTAAGLACWLGCVVGMLLFAIYFTALYDVASRRKSNGLSGQLIAVFLWGWTVWQVGRSGRRQPRIGKSRRQKHRPLCLTSNNPSQRLAATDARRRNQSAGAAGGTGNSSAREEIELAGIERSGNDCTGRHLKTAVEQMGKD